MKQKILGLFIGITIGLVLVACGGSDAGSDNPPTGNSGDTVSKAEFDALKSEVAVLQATVAELRKSVTVAVGRPEATATLMAKTANGDEPQEISIGCAPSGYLPATQFTAEYIQCTTPQGFYVDVPKEGGPPRRLTAVYETTDCSGTPWVALDDVVGARRNGAVFSYGDNLGMQVGYIAPNPSTQTVYANSVFYEETASCTTYAGTRNLANHMQVSPHSIGTDGFSTTTGARNDYPPSTTTVQQ